MKRNYSEQHHNGYFRDQSNDKPFDDYNILEPSPDIDLNIFDDDDDELSDYTLMDNATDPDYEE
jgi:hypothetical protein